MPNNDTKDILIETAQQAWDNLELRYFERDSETMSHRVQGIIEADVW